VRVNQYRTSPAAVWRHLRGRGAQTTAHSAPGAAMALTMFGCVLVQAGSGLFASDDIYTDGPLVHYLSKAGVDLATAIHTRMYWVVLGLIVTHVGALGWYALHDDPIALSMLHGRTHVGVEPITRHHWMRAATTAIGATALVCLRRPLAVCRQSFRNRRDSPHDARREGGNRVRLSHRVEIPRTNAASRSLNAAGSSQIFGSAWYPRFANPPDPARGRMRRQTRHVHRQMILVVDFTISAAPPYADRVHRVLTVLHRVLVGCRRERQPRRKHPINIRIIPSGGGNSKLDAKLTWPSEMNRAALYSDQSDKVILSGLKCYWK
jgi:hypothetical protein